MAIIFSSENESLRDLFVCRAEGKISTELDGETVILDIASGIYSGLDPVGTMVWNMLEKPVAFTEIVQAVLAQFDVTEAQCSDDLCGFLNDLYQNKLIDVRKDESR